MIYCLPSGGSLTAGKRFEATSDLSDAQGKEEGGDYDEAVDDAKQLSSERRFFVAPVQD